MLFRNKICSHCGSNYDIVDPTCPSCHERDEDFESRGIPKNVIWLPIYKQLILFALGLIGLSLLSLLMEIFLIPFQDQFTESGLTMIINGFRYVSCLILMGLVIFKDFARFKPSFKKAFPWLIGLAGGIAVIFANYMTSFIVNIIYPTEINENQTVVNSVIDAFPVLSIFLLGIIGPVVEELTYRLGLFTFLYRCKRWVAYLVTVIVFAFIHFDFFAGSPQAYLVELLNLPSYLIVGFLFCLWYDLFGLPASITAHAVNNLFSILMMILTSAIS